jgi:hypothetical protein
MTLYTFLDRMDPKDVVQLGPKLAAVAGNDLGRMKDCPLHETTP